MRDVWRGLRTWSKTRDAEDRTERGDYKHPKVLAGRIAANINRDLESTAPLAESEFQVFSQFGDDGIIQHLIRQIPSIPHTFIEFGVEDYVESNTRFLLINNKWSGFVLDGSQANVNYILADKVSHLFNLRAEATFVTAENINAIVESSHFANELGILSIDIDGVDYWIWNALEVSRPCVVIVEFNSLFGPDRTITIPYRSDFNRIDAHPSKLYWGASLGAFAQLASNRNYAFVGCNENGNNAYFVAQECMAKLRSISVREGYRAPTFTEFTKDGKSRRGDAALDEIKGLEVINTITGIVEKL